MTQQAAESPSGAAAFVAQRLLSQEITNRPDLERAKRKAAALYSSGRYLSNAEILAEIPRSLAYLFEDLLRTHPRRSGSGIVVVTVFSAPFSCPHGTCTFCPGGPKEGTPQSYLADSPGMRSALAAHFDSFAQARRSLEKYLKNGHPVSKVEAVLEGGTFLAVPLEYQAEFVKGLYEGLNGGREATLEDAQRFNETAESRCVGLTIESKPDWCGPEHVDLMLTYGTTRVEVGVQCLRDGVLKRANRGHTVEDSISAIRVARDAGLKVAVHMMPGLPGATPEEDLADLRRLFEDEAFVPDMMKVYPTLVVVGTALKRQYEAGLYRPYETEGVIELLSEMKRYVPKWHRIMRIQREIPAQEIVAGVKNGNLRELVLERVKDKGYACRCIRCREVALGDPRSFAEEDDLMLSVEKYGAAGGEELFASYEYSKSGKIAGFARMRNPSASAHRPEMKNACVVRELKVYGRAVPVGETRANAWQHRGLGSALMREAERAAREDYGAGVLLVTSAVGTRNYYRMLGYETKGPYMAKRLN